MRRGVVSSLRAINPKSQVALPHFLWRKNAELLKKLDVLVCRFEKTPQKNH